MLLRSKLYPPSVPAQAIVRERLFESLSAGRALKLTLVAAPAGAGKSTMLAAWREVEAARRPFAWVTLDESDEDPVVLWSHVIEAIGEVVPGFPRFRLLDAVRSAPIIEVALPGLVNALVEGPKVVLVLDDLHRLSARPAQGSVAWFLDHAPASVQTIVSTRTEAELGLARLRAHGQLAEIGVAQLAMQTGEAKEFMNRRLALDLGDADIDRIVARTEGWPAGIYLLALSLAGRSTAERHALVESFDGTSTHIVEFLSTEVLAAYPDELIGFLTRIAVLERFDADLCAAVAGEPAAGELLAALAGSNLFLIPLDDRGQWYRFHHLFARILRDELERREPGMETELHRRAERWHARNGRTEDAIHHAICGGDHDGAAEAIATSWVDFANSGRTSSVLDWLRRLPPTVLDGDSRLQIVRAWISALRGNERDMREAIATMEALGELESGPLPDGFNSIESSLALLRAAFAWGDVSAVLENGRRFDELEPEDSPWRAVLTWALGWANYCNGDLEEAERWFAETTEIAPASGQWIVGIAATADLSLIASRRNETAEASRLADEAVGLAVSQGLIDAREDGEVHTAHGVALAAQGRHEEAMAALERGVMLRRRWRQPLDLADGLIALAGVQARRGELEPAAISFDEAAAVLERCPDPGVLPERLASERRAAAEGPREEPAGELSEREVTVLRYLGSGLSERAIAAELYLSFNTVHSHVKSVYRKLEVSSRAGALERAAELGLI